MTALPLVRVIVFLLLIASIGSACDGAKHREGSPARARGVADDPVRAIVPLRPQVGLLAERGFTTGPIAVTGDHLFWAASRGEEGDDVLLVARDLSTHKTRVLAHGLSPLLGLASTTDRVVYAAQGSPGNRLVSASFTGENRRVLTNALAAPFDARGEMVAWAEAAGERQRVIALDLRTGRRLVALDAPRCRGKRCYRIDRVTVARDGLAFDLGAVGQGYPSFVARRSWRERRTEFVVVPGDPQPDLVRSRDGALYYQLHRGWMDWRFGEARPRRAPTNARLWPLEAQGRRRLVITGGVCKAKVGFLAGSTFTALSAPRSTPASPTRFGPLCRQIDGAAWSGGRLFLAWTLTPKVSVEGHTDIGVSGVITSVRVP